MKVVNITQPKSVSKNTVLCLEKMLEEAKEGKLQSFIGISMYNDMNMEHVLAGDVYGHYIAYMGMLSDFQIDFKKIFEE